ncbi:MAG: MBOAT family protein [Clostridia bacterium]|nr:MBOAT family protein [Clostridia bacterium]MBQ7897832.1 MBOAT family protein [Clostridia bacterium]
MLFSGMPFLFYFLPVVLIIYFIVPKCLKNTVLMLSSLIFYGWGEPKYLFLMIGSILLGYFLGMAIDKSKTAGLKKLFLSLSVISSVILLGFFKYADFFIYNFNAVTGLSIPLLKIALPIGISFYTFQILSYTIDVYRGDVPYQKNIINFATYVALFPQLIAGPIVRYVDVCRELEERTHSFEKFYLGIRRFAVGLSKKVLIANQMGEVCDVFRESADKSVLFFWVYALAFAIHVYFDFSGYSDMAIGLGKVFGFNFIENFNYPYISKSISEFWRRWHMSLGSWFRDYVYIPLGGNRVKTMRWLFNTFVVWMLTGLWHGAAWNFVVWGLIYAILLIGEKFFVRKLIGKNAIIAHIYTMLFVIIGFVVFNAPNMATAGQDLIGMFGLGGYALSSKATIYHLSSNAVIFILGIIGSTPLPKKLHSKLSESKLQGLISVIEPVAVVCLLLVCTAYLVDGSYNPFLYFRF